MAPCAWQLVSPLAGMLEQSTCAQATRLVVTGAMLLFPSELGTLAMVGTHLFLPVTQRTVRRWEGAWQWMPAVVARAALLRFALVKVTTDRAAK